MKLDNENLEIEFKCLIDENQYNNLIKKYTPSITPKRQINYYFDDENESLRNRKTVLRIRQKNTQYKLTKKETLVDNTIAESHVFLTEKDAKEMIESGFDGNIIGINAYVKCICNLTTDRIMIEYDDGKLFFDKSFYVDVTDFEIEFEGKSVEHAKRVFEKFLNENSITPNTPKSKFVRAYLEHKAKKGL